MARYTGRRSAAMVAPNGTGAAVLITARQWGLDAGRADIDMTMFNDNNKVTFKDLPNFTGDFEGVFDDTEETVFEASESDAAVRMYLYVDRTNLAGRYWYGLANLDALSAKRQRVLPSRCRVYDLLNFASEVATHHSTPAGSQSLQAFVGTTVADEFDLEGTASKGSEFADLFVAL